MFPMFVCRTKIGEPQLGHDSSEKREEGPLPSDNRSKLPRAEASTYDRQSTHSIIISAHSRRQLFATIAGLACRLVAVLNSYVLALDRLNVMYPAAIPLRAEPAATRCGELVEQAGHRMIRTMRADQVAARKAARGLRDQKVQMDVRGRPGRGVSSTRPGWQYNIRSSLRIVEEREDAA